MKKQILSVIMAISILLTSASPIYAALPSDLTERKNEYTVVIDSGNGNILQNKDETNKTQVGVQGNDKLSYSYIDAKPEDFTEIEKIELTVRENETVKNRLNYSKKITKTILFFSDMDLYDWNYEAFLTSTRVVQSVLGSGLNTNFKPGGRIIDDIRINIYPASVKRAYLFVPKDESLIFSHFEDQNGNTFTLDTPVTEDLVLTPIYLPVESVVSEDTFFGEQIHNVTILKGEGKLQTLINGNWTELDDSFYEETDKISLVVKHGDVNFSDITSTYSRLKYGDIEKSDIQFPYTRLLLCKKS